MDRLRQRVRDVDNIDAEQRLREGHAPGSRRLLVVTTVPITLTAFLLPLTKRLRDIGWEVDCLSAGRVPGNPMPTSENPQLAAAFNQRFDIGWSRSAARTMSRYPSLAQRVREVVAAGEYDVVHVHTPLAAWVTRAALRDVSPRPRIIYTAHGFHFFEGHTDTNAELFHAAEKRAAHWTDDLVVINKEDEAAARKLVEGTRCRVHRIDGVGIELDEYDRTTVDARNRAVHTRAKYRAPESAFVVSMVAEYNHNKRPMLLLQAAVEVVHALPNLRVIMVGDGPLRPQLQRRIDALRLRETVVLTGQLPHDEVKAIAQITDVGVLLSEREGLPRSLMEFVAAGATIAGTRTRGIVDEVRVEAALAQRPTAHEIARVLINLGRQPALRADVHVAQYAKAKELFDMDVILAKYEALYRESM